MGGEVQIYCVEQALTIPFNEKNIWDSMPGGGGLGVVVFVKKVCKSLRWRFYNRGQRQHACSPWGLP